MTKIRQVRTSFNAGEMISTLDRRIDVDAYHNGAALVRDFRLLPYGGVTRRPGTRKCALIPNTVWQAEDFVFNEDQAYMVLFAPTEAYIFDGEGIFLQALTGLPWTSAHIGELSVAQQGDVMLIAHEAFQTILLRRIGATTFSYELFQFEKMSSGATASIKQPYYKYARPEVTLRVGFVSYSGGGLWNEAVGFMPGTTVTVDCNVAMFSAGYVGQFLQWGHKGYIEVTSYNTPTQVLGVVRSAHLELQMGSNPLRSQQGYSAVIMEDPFHGFGATQNVYVSGAFSFRNLTDAALNGHKTVAAADDLTWHYDTGIVADQSTHGGGDGVRVWASSMATREWMEPAFSAMRGWPRSVTFDDQRLVFGGSRSLPGRLFESRIDAPFDFFAGTGKDNEAIQASMASQRVVIIRSVVSSRHLLLFTSEGEFMCPGSDNKPLTPATISFKRQTPYGIASVPPVEFDGSVLFVTKTGAIREFVFVGDDGAYQSPSLSFMAQHLLNAPVRLESQIEASGEQEAIGYVVNANGTLAVLTFSRKEKILGWSLWSTQGTIADVVSVNRRLYAIVVRGVRTFLEEFNKGSLVDCSTGGVVSPTTVIGGLSHYNGTTVNLLSFDGTNWEDLGTALVSGDAVTFPKPVTTYNIGYGFVPTLQTLPPELNMQDGPSIGQPRRVVRSQIDVEATCSAASNGTNIELKSIANINAAAPQKTGNFEFWHQGWDKRGQVTITCPENLPITVKSVLVEVEF